MLWPARRLRPAVWGLLAGLLLLALAAPRAHALAPKVIGFDDATGAIGDSYFSNTVEGVRFDGTDPPFGRVADPGAKSAPNVATVPYFPGPRARHGIRAGLSNSGGTIEFPFSHTSVAMYVGHTQDQTGTLIMRAFDVNNNLLSTDQTTFGGTESADRLLSVFDFSGRIQHITVDGDGNGWIFDDFRFDVPDTPPPADFGMAWDDRAAGQVPVAPGQSTDTDVDISRVNGSTGDVNFSVSGLPAGVSAQVTPNPAGGSATHSTATVHLTASGNAPGALRRPVTVTATPSSATVGATARTVTIPVTVLSQFDLRARGLEITQGIQPGGPGQGLPQVDTGNRTASYRGVRLTAFGYKPTIVRFYADAAGAPTGGAGADATLEGFRDGRPLPGSPLHPDGGGGSLIDQGPGEQVTYQERMDDIHPFNFTIPPGWQDGHISLVGHVFVPPTFAFGATQQECGQAFCAQDNTTTLNDIGFTQEAVDSVDPVKIVYSDRTKPGSPFVQPPEGDWWDAFSAAKKVDPIGILPHYWRGTIDVTTHKEFHGFKGWVTRSFINSNGIERNDKSSEVLDDIDDWADDYADVNWPVGLIHRFNLYDGNTQDLGSSHGGPLNSDRPTAVVSPDRPLGSVAHELGHNLGRQHASAGCGGGANGQTAEGWPDPYGYIEGVGIDLTQPASDGGQYKVIAGNMGAGGCATNNPPDCGGTSPTQPFDYMSYCANEANAWISGIGWDEIINAYNLGSRARARVASAAAVKRPGVKVRGYVTSTGVQITDVEKGKFAATRAPSGSTFSLQATNASGQVLKTTAMAVVSGHTDASGGAQPTLSFEGTVPAASAASVRVLRQGALVARRDRSAHAPKVRITAPKARSVVGRKKTVVVKWKATDADKTPVDISVDYSANGGKSYHRIYMGPNRGKVSLPRAYFSHARKARVRVTADDGFNQTTATSKVFRSLGAPPIIRLNAPLKGTVKAQDATLLLQGFALDDTNKRLKGKRLTWYYAGRVVAHGENTSVAGMLAGKHSVKLVARDSSGRRASRSVTVRLTAVQPSFKKVRAPRKVSRKAKKVTLKVSSSVDVPLKIGKQRFTVHQGLTTVKVKVKPGRSKLTFHLVIGSGKLTAKRTVTVKRG